MIDVYVDETRSLKKKKVFDPDKADMVEMHKIKATINYEIPFEDAAKYDNKHLKLGTIEEWVALKEGFKGSIDLGMANDLIHGLEAVIARIKAD